MTDAPIAILYVDDDPDVRTIVEMSLHLDPGLELRSVASGHEALAMMGAGGWCPDAILLDVMMPEMTGPETLAALRAEPQLATVPALFITARGREMDLSEYRRLGASGTILKPFDPLTLATQVRTLLAGAGAV